MPFCHRNFRLLTPAARATFHTPLARLLREEVRAVRIAPGLSVARCHSETYVWCASAVSFLQSSPRSHTIYGIGQAVMPVRRITMPGTTIGTEFGPCYLPQLAGWRHASKSGGRGNKDHSSNRRGTGLPSLSSRSISMARSWHLDCGQGNRLRGPASDSGEDTGGRPVALTGQGGRAQKAA